MTGIKSQEIRDQELQAAVGENMKDIIAVGYRDVLYCAL